jgi:hypothetical protein
MMLAGIPVSPDLVRELADLVDEPTAGVLEKALDTDVLILALTIEDRERILWARSTIHRTGSRSDCCSTAVERHAFVPVQGTFLHTRPSDLPGTRMN